MSRLKAARRGCTVRMYRHGLGDCFLLAFANGSGHQKYVLIDCGVLVGSPNAQAEMEGVAKDIHEATGGQLDAVVVTHEHWDHVSGFVQVPDLLARLQVEELWLAWTEDPDNLLARELRERGKIALDAIERAFRSLKDAKSAYARQAESLLAFHQEGLAAAGRTTADAMRWAKDTWSNHRYLTPGMKPLRLHGLPDVRFYVLGPPEDKTYLKRSRPRKSQHETYLDSTADLSLVGLLQNEGAALPAAGAPPRSPEYADLSRPFNAAYELCQDEDEAAATQARYESKPDSWRKIDLDWMEAAGELAIRLDSHLNNTSLVLAIELEGAGRVLLFPGDAQVGNWRSWHDLEWVHGDRSVDATDLLRRTVLYKVGHHASHNATLSDLGLELMTDRALSSLIPVDRATALKRHWSMPHPPLHERLVRKTDGRTWLADEGVPDLSDGDCRNIPGGQVEQHAQYIDVRFRHAD